MYVCIYIYIYRGRKRDLWRVARIPRHACLKDTLGGCTTVHVYETIVIWSFKSLTKSMLKDISS